MKNFGLRVSVRARACPAATLAVALLGIAGLSANATIVATTNSLPFSIGYGATSKSTTPFTTTETSTYNTPTTQGAFTLTPTVTGDWFASAGMQFTGRVLTNVINNNESVGISADSGHFLLSITSTYTGSVPTGLTPIISLNLSELRIRGIADATNVYPGVDLKWTEITGGVTNSSAPVNLLVPNTSPPSYYYTNANNWTTLSWNPGEIYTTNALSQTRTFRLTTAIPGAGGYGRAIEGLEIFGTVDVFFMIPEPSTAVLLGSGLATLWLARRRRFRRG